MNKHQDLKFKIVFHIWMKILYSQWLPEVRTIWTSPNAMFTILRCSAMHLLQPHSVTPYCKSSVLTYINETVLWLLTLTNACEFPRGFSGLDIVKFTLVLLHGLPGHLSLLQVHFSYFLKNRYFWYIYLGFKPSDGLLHLHFFEPHINSASATITKIKTSWHSIIQLYYILIAWFKSHCGKVRRQNYKKCVTVQKPTHLTVLEWIWKRRKFVISICLVFTKMEFTESLIQPFQSMVSFVTCFYELYYKLDKPQRI